MTEAEKQLAEDRAMMKRWTEDLEKYECRARKFGYCALIVCVFLILIANFPR